MGRMINEREISIKTLNDLGIRSEGLKVDLGSGRKQFYIDSILKLSNGYKEEALTLLSKETLFTILKEIIERV